MKVFITGAASGIGRAVVKKLLEHGHEVVAFDIDGAALDRLPDEVTTYHGDVYDEDRVKEVLEWEEFDVLLNCAAYYELGAIEDVSSEDVEAHFDVNVFGLLNVTRHALPMLRERSGRVVNLSSVAGRVSAPYFGIYSATKHAVEAISDSLRMEMKPFDVDVVVIEPGPVETGFNDRARQKLSKYLPDTVYRYDYEDILDGDGLEGVSPEKAAEKVVKAIEAPNPKSRYKVGLEAKLAPKLQVLPQWIQDRIIGDY